ncbi:MAG: 2,3,4,5-tetrahydropyridine-2,6-dicarboxylate N-succinyltransferase, partial [Microbacteriaceae bacterium]|nr:2,3,4,5-tetrahydropyridine-2,6-dicarboxylate N-succinyltransferase [Microbacteriaceae bacterium]
MTRSRTASATGLATIAADGSVLDAWFERPELAPLNEEAGLPPSLLTLQGHDAQRNVELKAVRIEIDLDRAPASVEDAYLRLHLLSHCLVKPNTINLDGIFGVLPLVAWTTAGPMQPDEFSAHVPKLKRAGITLVGLDKFPRLTDYVVPKGVRIADTSRVRLGAHLAPGTTVMH